MKCKCDFRTFMVGDGCDVCNPAKALEYARETIDEQAALIEETGEALQGMLEIYGVTEQNLIGNSMTSHTEVECCDQARAAIAKATGESK